jgi:glycosyltransferase involved in cell wall biosynthesis
MKIVYFTHPAFNSHQSMPRFAGMLAEGMQARGHVVEVWSPKPYFFKMPLKASLKKWMGYIDQFVVFPMIVRKRVRKRPVDTLYVFTDHALGMWVPIVKHLPHVIICHDFLAQQSAKGEIPQNPTGKSGQKYQQLIHKGYSLGANFISVSNKTKQDLHHFLGRTPQLSKVVYNGLNKQLKSIETAAARSTMSDHTGIDLSGGYILHIGGNQWYKNRTGVVKIYNAWRKAYNNKLALVLVGHHPSPDLASEIAASVYKSDIYVLDNLDDEYINAAYSGALLLLFPSLAEGFGWPIAEAMAAGCAVITTNATPMTEVGGEAAIYLPMQPFGNDGAWASESANVLNQVINLPVDERAKIITQGLENAKRFDAQKALNEIESIFNMVLNGN